MHNPVAHAFPDFDDTLPEIDGFEDDSWGNDTMPSMFDAARRLKLFVDYKNPERSEYPDARISGELKRYQLQLMSDDGDYLGDLCVTDSLDEVLDAIARHDAAAEQERGTPGPRR